MRGIPILHSRNYNFKFHSMDREKETNGGRTLKKVMRKETIKNNKEEKD